MARDCFNNFHMFIVHLCISWELYNSFGHLMIRLFVEVLWRVFNSFSFIYFVEEVAFWEESGVYDRVDLFLGTLL